jgi:hypothetical protein
MSDYNSLLQELMSQKEKLEKLVREKSAELQRINSAIESLNGPVPRNIRFNWTDAVLECIQANGIFLQTLDILEFMFSGADELEDEKRRRNATVSLSVTLNNLCNKGILRKIVVSGVKGHFYGLPDWFAENGNPKPVHIANLMMKYGRLNVPMKLSIAELAGAGLAD